MSKDKFLLMIRDEDLLKKLTKDMDFAFDEREMLSYCTIARVNVIPSQRDLEIFLDVSQLVKQPLLLKLACKIKAKYNPDGEVTISPRPIYRMNLSLFDEEQIINQKVSTRDLAKFNIKNKFNIVPKSKPQSNQRPQQPPQSPPQSQSQPPQFHPPLPSTSTTASASTTTATATIPTSAAK